ncbi:MAG: hypothetical protein GXY32_11590 [Ruminococcaceae bacterium]|nr:hypothetical protein [Oscillospiraceae bacterium]
MQLLFIDACVRGEASRTHRLAQVFITAYQKQWPAHTVTTLTLTKEDLQPHTPAGLEKRDALLRQGRLDDAMFRFAHQFAAADKIVIAAPYWDLTFPALLKTYIERVCVDPVTFHYTDVGIDQLCKAEKLLYITTAGGIIEPYNLGFAYVEGLCDYFFGIPQRHFASAEGLDIVGANVESILGETQAELEALARTF